MIQITVYARSDVASITISSAHGGCGGVHVRPAPGGEPVKVWGLTCSPCEDLLRLDSLWGATETTIPETPDEKINREANEKRTAVEQAAQNVQAMQKLGDMPGELAKILAALIGGNAQLPTDYCPAGHVNPGSAKFCGDCGSSMEKQGPMRPVDSLPEPDLTEEPQDEPKGFLKPAEEVPDLDAMSLGELKKLATSYGVEPRRSKADMLAALRDHLER